MSGNIMLQNVMFIALGGAVGAISRYLISEIVDSSEFPLATFIVNTLGCLLIGFLSAFYLENLFSETVFLTLGIGVLGAFTTMSTFSLENINFMREGEYAAALFYISCTFIICIFSTWVGLFVGQKIT